VAVFLLWKVAVEARKTLMQQSGGLLLPPVQTLVATTIFAEGKNANEPRHPFRIVLP